MTSYGKTRHAGTIAAIIQQVADGRVQIGGLMLPETEIMAMLDVSRTVVRESFKVLQAKGFLTIEWGVGTRVSPLEEWDLTDPGLWRAALRCGDANTLIKNLLAVRFLIEPRLAELAAISGTDDEVDSLVYITSEMQAVVANRDIERYNDLDDAFHDQVAKMARNLLLLQTLRRMNIVFRIERRASVDSIETVKRSLAGHLAISEAISHRHGQASREAMERHLKEFEANIGRVMRDQTSTFVRTG